MNQSLNLSSSNPDHGEMRESVLFPGGRASGAQREHGDARNARGTMQALVVAGLIAVSSILAAVLTHAATNPQVYI